MVTITILNSEKCLEKLLEKRGMICPYGKALYKYQISYLEFKQIQQVLRDTFKNQNLNRVSNSWASLFTIYVAEWFRREYKEGWTWEPILNSLWVIEMPVNTRNDLVTKGLNFWKRPLVKYTKANNYLGSIFKEGGFPSRLLKDDGNKYISIFQKVISLYLENKSAPYELRDVIQQELKSLPQAFEYDETLELVIEIVKLIIEKVEEFDLDKHKDPIVVLDQKSKYWRNEFPLPIDDDKEIVDKFLRNLFESASVEVTKHKEFRQSQKCINYFTENFQHLFTAIHLPQELNFKVDQDFELFKTRGQLVVKEGWQGRSQFLCVGYLSHQDKKIVAEINRGFSSEIRRKVYTEKLYLCLEIDGLTIDHIELEHTALDFDTLPIGFTIAKQPKYIAQGAFKTQETEILLSLPIDASFDLTNSEDHPQQVGGFQNFNLYKINGLQHILTQDGDSIEVKCGHDKTEFEQLLFRAHNLSQLKTTPSMAFTGKPVLRNYGDKLYLGQQDLESVPLHLILGKQMLTLKNLNGENLLKKQVIILPPSFKVETKAGYKLEEAEICITSDAQIQIEVLNPDTLLNISNSGLIYKCSIRCLEVPLELKLKITFKFGGEFLLSVPFPARGIKLVNDHGEMKSKEFVISDLISTELIVYSYERPTTFCFEVLLKSKKNHEQNPPFYRAKIKVKQGISFINLYDFIEEIKGILSLSDDLDSYVICTIYNHEMKSTWNIKHYGRQLSWGKLLDAYYDPERTIQQSNIALKPQFMSLIQPQLEAQDLILGNFWEGGKSFQLPELDMSLAPYLLIPAKGTTLFRPKLIPKFDYVQDIQVEGLTKSIRNFGQNTESIDQYVQNLNFDGKEELWSYVQAIFDNYEYLPLNTFEVLKSLARNFDALAITVFKLDLPLEILRRFETELSVLWYLIPISSWNNAIDQLIHSWTKIADDDGYYGKNKARKLLNNMKKITPLLDESFHEFYLNGTKEFGPLGRLDFLQNYIFEGKNLGGKENCEYQHLLHRHKADTENGEWPNDLSINRWEYFSSIQQLPFKINLASQWNKDVVYFPFCLAYLNVVKNSKFEINPKEILHIKQIILFDEQWFNFIFSSVVKYLILETK